jgi:hypothetical protein
VSRSFPLGKGCGNGGIQGLVGPEGEPHTGECGRRRPGTADTSSYAAFPLALGRAASRRRASRLKQKNLVEWTELAPGRGALLARHV